MYFYSLKCWDYEESDTAFTLTCDKQYTKEQFYDLIMDLMVDHYNPDEGMDTTDALLRLAVKDLVDLFGFEFLRFEATFGTQWAYIPDELNEINSTTFLKMFKQKLDKLKQ